MNIFTPRPELNIPIYYENTFWHYDVVLNSSASIAGLIVPLLEKVKMDPTEMAAFIQLEIEYFAEEMKSDNPFPQRLYIHVPTKYSMREEDPIPVRRMHFAMSLMNTYRVGRQWVVLTRGMAEDSIIISVMDAFSVMEKFHAQIQNNILGNSNWFVPPGATPEMVEAVLGAGLIASTIAQAEHISPLKEEVPNDYERN